MKYFLIILAVFILPLLALFSLKVLPFLTAKPAVKINYVAQYNRITKPPDYDPNENAAPYYEKAFELLVDMPNDIKDLATKIEILLADPALRARLGKLGRKRMEDALEWKYQAPVLLEAYAHTFSEKSKTLARLL